MSAAKPLIVNAGGRNYACIVERMMMPRLDSLAADLRYAARLLRAKPAFTLVAVLSLGLGIGANTAIFTLINTVLLKPLPVKDPAGLVMLSNPDAAGVAIGASGGERALFSYQEYEQLRDRTDAFSGLLAAESGPDRTNARIDAGPTEQVLRKLVSANYFEVLGVAPVAGRTFAASDESGPGSAPYAVVSHTFWKRRLGGDSSALGRKIQTGRAQLTIIGVMPPGFFGESAGRMPDVWVPMGMQPQLMPGRPWLRDDYSKVERVMWLHVMGRLKPGAMRPQALANASVVFRQIVKQQAAAASDAEGRRNLENQRIVIQDGAKGASYVRSDAFEPLLLLMGVVALVLLIACANVANLLLARAASRQKEIGIRIAMGAGRGRLIRQALTESMLLSLMGGAIGLLFAMWGTEALTALAGGGTAIPLDTHPDAGVLAFTAGLSILTGLVFGLAPALRVGSFDPGNALKENSRGLTESGRRINAGRALVAGQIAISFVLIIVAGLFVRTLANLQSVDLGYSREKLLVVRVDALGAGYQGAQVLDLYKRLREKLRALPGVRAVAYSENGLFGGTESRDNVSVEGYKPGKPGGVSANWDQVGPGYFQVVGIPILLGRGIGPEDTAPSRRVCVINETMARFFFGKASPLGKHVTNEFPDTRLTYEIVGVSRDARDHQIRGEVPKRFYVPVAQPTGPVPAAINFEIRTSADPGAILGAAQRAILDVDRNVPIRSAKTMDMLLDDSMQSDQMIAKLSGFFGGLALLLAAIGIYGVLSYAIARRTSEFGIRMALGAAPGSLLSMLLRETFVLVAVGAACGLPLALGASRAISSRLYGLGMADPATLLLAAAILGGVALASGYLPARRASRVDPVVALRSE